MAMFNFDFSPEAELRRERARLELEQMRNRSSQQASEASMAAIREKSFREKAAEIDNLGKYTKSLEQEAARIEAELPALSRSGDSMRFQIAAKRLTELRDGQGDRIGEISRNKSYLQTLSSNLEMSMAEGNPSLQKAIVQRYMAQYGVDPKAAGQEPTVKFKSKRKGKDFGDEDEVSYEVPASIADKFVQGGDVPLPSSAYGNPQAQQSNVNLLTSLMNTGISDIDNNMFAEYQPSGGGSVSPMSTGEQPITATNLFAQQPQAQASPNPFTQSQPQQKRKRYNPVTGQLESY